MRPRILNSHPVKKSVLPLLVCLALAGCFKSSEERAAEHFESGMELIASGDLDRAMVEFRNVLKFSENDPEARRQIALIHQKADREGLAYRSLLAVVEQLPEDFEARVILSELAFSLLDWGEFERHGAKALELAAESDDADLVARAALFDLAIQYREAETSQDRPAMEALLTKTLEAQEQGFDTPITRRILISGYVQTNRYEEALAQLDRAIAAEPDTLEHYGGRLDLLSRLGDAAAAEAELERMVQLFPDDDNVKATYLRFLGAKGDLGKAEQFLRTEVETAPDDETRTNRLTTLVTFLLRTEGIDAALSEIDTALATAQNDKLRMMRASLAFDSGNQQEGITELEQILGASEEDSQLDPAEKRDGQVLLARMLAETGNEVGARTIVEEVLAADPSSANAHKMNASWLIAEDNTEAAINGLRTALDVNPEDAEAMTLIAQAYERAGNTNLKLTFLSRAAEATNNAPAESLRYARALIQDDKALQAETTLIASLRLTPGNVDVLTLLGQIYLQIDDNARARQVVATLNDIDTPQAQSNAETLNLELVAREQGSEEALGLLEDLANREGDAGTQAKLGVIRARIANGDTEGALKYAQELVAAAPDDPRMRYALALTHATLRNYDVAEEQLRALVDDTPAAIGAWLQLVRLQTNRGDTAAASATLDEALTVAPDAPDLLWAKASVLQNEGDIDGAIEIFDTLYETNSDSLIVANNLASLITTYRPTPENIERASLIVRRLTDTTVPAFQDTFGWIQHLNGDHETALRYLEPAAKALTRDVAVQVHLGMVYDALGRPDDALAQLRRALEIDGPLSGNEELVERARAKIAELESPAPTSE